MGRLEGSRRHPAQCRVAPGGLDRKFPICSSPAWCADGGKIPSARTGEVRPMAGGETEKIDERMTGSCFCGAVTYRIASAPFATLSLRTRPLLPLPRLPEADGLGLRRQRHDREGPHRTALRQPRSHRDEDRQRPPARYLSLPQMPHRAVERLRKAQGAGVPPARDLGRSVPLPAGRAHLHPLQAALGQPLALAGAKPGPAPPPRARPRCARSITT